MIFHRKLKQPLSLAFYILCFIVFAAFTRPSANHKKQTRNDYYKDKAARNLSDSLDVLLNQIGSSFGGKEPDIASTSKSLTGTLAAILDRKGIIKLDGTIAEYLPGFTFDDQKIHPDKISIRSLITHTHGIKNNDAVVWTAFIGIKSTEQLMSMLKTRSTALPDDRFNYSNLGPVIYAMIVQKQLGKPWQQVMDAHLFQPFDMKKTTAYVSKADAKYISCVIDESEGKLKGIFDKADNSMSAAGGHLTMVNDLLKYLQFFISEGNSVPGVLSKEEIAMATSAIVPQKSQYQSYGRFGYGLGWEQSVFNGEQLVSRLGGYSGLSSHLSFMKDQKIGVVVLSNKKGMEALAHLVANYIYNSLLNKDNKHSIAKENLVSLQKNFESDVLETNRRKFWRDHRCDDRLALSLSYCKRLK
jgi:CubicO group peptidase (beta-lactamase class C family)